MTDAEFLRSLHASASGPIVSAEERAIEAAVRQRRAAGLKVEHDPLGWWVMDYAQRRGEAPTVVGGPFEKEKAAKDLRDHLAYHEGET